jgi:hypothetical protein
MNEKLRALYKGALQGSTMGLADEAIGGVGALYARALNPELFQGDSFSNTYAQARDLDRAENKQLEQNNPWTYGGANLVGGVAMPMGMAGQGLKGAVKAGGIAGGLTGYGMSENTNPYALALDTATGAGLGAGAGAALYGAGKVATNPQVQKFAKDYIADESGALTIGGDYINDATDYFVKKAKENGFDIGDISRSLNRNKERSNYMNMSQLGQVRISDHLSNPNFNTSNGNIIVSEKDYKNQIDNFLENIKSGIDKQKNEQNVTISNVNLDGLRNEMSELKSKKTRLSDYKYESRLRDLEKKYNLPAFELNKSYINKKISGEE